MRGGDRIKTAVAQPLEKDRVMCPKEDIDQYFVNLKRSLDGVTMGLICNLDEMGYADAIDTRQITVVVPAAHKDKTVLLPYERVNNRLTLIEAIFGDGTRAKPAMIIRRKTIEQEVLRYGLTKDKIAFYYQENGFINKFIFEDYCINNLFPDIIRRLEAYREYLNDNTLRFYLLMDSMTAHFSDAFDDFCLSHGIEIHCPPPHSSDQFQALDLCVFSAIKTYASKIGNIDKENKQSTIIKTPTQNHSVKSISYRANQVVDC